MPVPTSESNAVPFNDLRVGGITRAAIEKFAGAWLACSLVMARGDVAAAVSLEHVLVATVCGVVGAAVAVGLLTQMDRTVDSLYRQVTISVIATFIGNVFALPSQFGPQWAEPLTTAAVSGGIAVVLWYAKRMIK